MPIRALKKFQVQCDWPITALKETKIAIDGFWFIRKYFNLISVEDLVKNLDLYVEENLKGLMKFRNVFEIIWIWDGFKYKHENISQDDLLNKDIYNVSTNRMFKFGKSNAFMELLVNPINRYLNDCGISYCRAPYGAIAQSVYFLRTNCVDYLFAKTDIFLFKDVNKCIVEFDFETGKYCLFDKAEIEKQLQIKKGLFKFYALASGCDFCPTLPQIAEEFDFDELRRLFETKTKNDKGEMTLFESHVEENEEYKILYNNAISNCKWHPVMTLNGKVEPLDTQYVPVDLNKIFGYKLPGGFYERLFECKFQPEDLNGFLVDSDYISNVKEIDDVIEIFNSLILNKRTKDFDTKYFLDLIKGCFNLKYDHIKDLERNLELVFAHFIRDKSNMSNTLKNCTAGRNVLKDALLSFTVEDKLNFEDLVMFFRIRKYLNWLKMTYIAIIEFDRSTRNIEHYSAFDFTLKFCIKTKAEGYFKAFLEKL